MPRWRIARWSSRIGFVANQSRRSWIDCLVHFSRRRDEPIRWNLVTTEGVGAADAAALAAAPFAATPDLQDQLSARRLSAAQQAALGLAAGGEVWELTFRQPAGKPLEIQAIRNSALTADTPLSLAELVQASEQQGSVGDLGDGPANSANQ